jgi:hypothetical protein
LRRMDVSAIDRMLRVLLLLSTLSSAPIGSMEQGGPEFVVSGHALVPALRLDSTPVIARSGTLVNGSVRDAGSLGPDERLRKEPCGEHLTLGVVAARPAGSESSALPSGCRILPYHAIPPPPRSGAPGAPEDSSGIDRAAGISGQVILYSPGRAHPAAPRFASI